MWWWNPRAIALGIAREFIGGTLVVFLGTAMLAFAAFYIMLAVVFGAPLLWMDARLN